MRFRGFLLALASLLVATFALGADASGEFLERVVATIDDEPVFLSELRAFQETSTGVGTMSDALSLERLIDRKLLLFEARRLRLDRMGGAALSDAELIEHYVAFSVRTFGRRQWLKPGSGEEPAPVATTPGRPAGDASAEALRERIAELRRRYNIRVQPDYALPDRASRAP